MGFEDILKTVGDFGRYQWILVVGYMIPATLVTPWFILEPVFIASVPDHWCNAEELNKFSNLTVEQKLDLIRSKADPTCSRNEINYTRIFTSENWTIGHDWPTTPCDNGWKYDKTNFEETAVTKWNLVCKDGYYASLILSLIFMGDVIGTPIYGYMSDKIGRRRTFFIIALITGLTEIGSVTIPDFTTFIVLKGINGAGTALLSHLPYVIALELVTPRLRSRLNALTTTSWTVGMCLLALTAWFTHHWIKLGVFNAFIAFALFLYWKYLPESPSWLIAQRRYEDATEILNNIAQVNGVTVSDLFTDVKILGDKSEGETKENTTHSYLDIFRYPQLRKKFLLITLCWFGNLALYFGIQINATNISGNIFLNFFLVAVVEIPSIFVTWFCLDRLGRRWCSVGAFIISGVACILPVMFREDFPGLDMAASFFGKMGVSSAFMTVFQQAPELFPTPLRSRGMALSSTIASVASLSVPYVIHLGVYGKHIPFAIFAGISLVSATAAAFLPETLNENLPQNIGDAENFGLDQKFFSCPKKKNTHSVKRNTCSQSQGTANG